ncbi:MAG: SsrA-binding protein SmpB [Planctomycetes bacterium]|nr:SsrA-binding protein SmpB [Planctomycetota bacterium]
MSAAKKPNTTSAPPVARNRRARFDYEILETIEAGLVLQGSEVKSLREGGVSLEEAYVRILSGEAWLLDCTIPEWKQAVLFGHATQRARKLLLHRREIEKLREHVRLQGLTVVPLAIYFKAKRAKCEIALVRGKKKHDKRESAKEKVAKKEMREYR